MSESIQEWLIGMDEACQLLGFKKSYLYKLTSTGLVPSYKPWGKKLFFDKREIEELIRNGKQLSNEDIKNKSIEYMCENRMIHK
jgi:prophage regulatory protein